MKKFKIISFILDRMGWAKKAISRYCPFNKTYYAGLLCCRRWVAGPARPLREALPHAGQEEEEKDASGQGQRLSPVIFYSSPVTWYVEGSIQSAR